MSQSLIRRMVDRVARARAPRRELLLVVDQSGWILDEVAQQLHAQLTGSMHCRVVAREWMAARDCTIHFINRVWAWTDGVLDRVHPSNRLIGLWWHGQVNSPEPSMQAALQRLRQLHGRFDRLQVPCTIARETLLSLGVPAQKIALLPEGVDVRMFRSGGEGARVRVRRELGIDEGALVIGCFQKDGDGWDAGDSPKMIKGPDVLVDALIRLHAAVPIVALVPGPARGYVTRRLADAGVPFSAPGFVPRVAVPTLYDALDLYISPSRDEGGPAGVLEAMASGVPVVSTRTGMPVDLIESGVNGVLVDVDDAADLAASASALLLAPQMRVAMAERARETIVRFDWSVLAPRYVAELYEPLGRMAR